jgi:hypothetical protein
MPPGRHAYDGVLGYNHHAVLRHGQCALTGANKVRSTDQTRNHEQVAVVLFSLMGICDLKLERDDGWGMEGCGGDGSACLCSLCVEFGVVEEGIYRC